MSGHHLHCRYAVRVDVCYSVLWIDGSGNRRRRRRRQRRRWRWRHCCTKGSRQIHDWQRRGLLTHGMTGICRGYKAAIVVIRSVINPRWTAATYRNWGCTIDCMGCNSIFGCFSSGAPTGFRLFVVIVVKMIVVMVWTSRNGGNGGGSDDDVVAVNCTGQSMMSSSSDSRSVWDAHDVVVVGGNCWGLYVASVRSWPPCWYW